MKYRKELRRRLAACIVLIFMIGMFCSSFFSAAPVRAATPYDFSSSNVLDDLKSATVDGKPLDLAEYPLDKTGLAHSPKIINFVEYCYSLDKDKQADYGIYVYFYNPQAISIDTFSGQNKIQIATGYDANGVPDNYEKYDLKFCSKSDWEYNNLFYKFKIIDRKSDLNGKTILERVNKTQRRYDVSGIEFLEKQNTNAKEYKVGGTYRFNGYAKGYGAAGSFTSTLECEVNELETVSLKVERTNFRSSGVSSAGKNHQNNLTSVYFSVPDLLLKNYGKLQKIKAEWWEYKTNPVVVLEKAAAYDALQEYIGVSAPPNCNYTNTNPFSLNSDDSRMQGNMEIFTWTYNGYWKSGSNEGGLPSDDPYGVLYNLFTSKGVPVSDYVLSSKKLSDYIYAYNKTFHNGTINCNGRPISADLFVNGGKSVDSNRTAGYNLHNIDSDDTFDMLSYDTNHNGWDKFWDYGFWSPDTSEEYKDVKPIYEVTDEDLAEPENNFSKQLLINSNDIAAFKAYCAAAKLKQETTFLFRFAMTDYYSLDIFATNYADKTKNSAGYMAQETVYLDFDILELTFNREGVYKVIPVVSSPMDIIEDITPPLEEVSNIPWWVLLIIAVVGLIILVVLCLYFFPNVLIFLLKGLGLIIWHILRGLWWLVSAPVRLIILLFKKRDEQK